MYEFKSSQLQLCQSLWHMLWLKSHIVYSLDRSKNVYMEYHRRKLVIILMYVHY